MKKRAGGLSADAKAERPNALIGDGLEEWLDIKKSLPGETPEKEDFSSKRPIIFSAQGSRNAFYPELRRG